MIDNSHKDNNNNRIPDKWHGLGNTLAIPHKKEASTAMARMPYDAE